MTGEDMAGGGAGDAVSTPGSEMSAASDDHGFAPIVILVGAPGSGKTAVGSALAARLGVPFRDTDADIEAETGQAISDIFLTHGEDTFRDLERAAVVEALAGHPGVLALGGGAVLDEELRTLLSLAPTVWLQVSAPVATARVGMNTARPVLLGNVRQQLAALLVERDPLYLSVASATVVTDDLDVDAAVDAVVSAVPTLGSNGRGTHG